MRRCARLLRSVLHDHRSGGDGDLLRVHLDDVIEREEGQRNSDRRRRRGPDLEQGEADQAERECDLEIDAVVRSQPQIAIALLEEIHDRASAFRMAREKLRFLLDSLRQIVEFGAGRATASRSVTLEVAVESLWWSTS